LLEQHATHFDEKTEAMNIELTQLFSTNGSFKKVVTLSDSIAAILPLPKSHALPNKRLTEIHSSINYWNTFRKIQNSSGYQSIVVL
jgi:hypothetical protein